jgi:aryl-alcohol dehydrogenase-like predicted oxidoreductase
MTTLGRSTVQVSPLCFGGNVFGWTVDEKNAFEILDAFVAGGGNFIDTADVYSAWVDGNKGGESETLIGKWLHARGNRDQVVIATKVGMLNNKGRRSDLSRAHILEAVEVSLKRLQTDYIDLYFAHADDEETPLEETLSTFAELVQAGKVRVLGASNYTAERMAEAQLICQINGLPRYEVQQPPYSLVNRSVYEGALQDFCVANQISVVTYSSLGSGFLSGKYRQNAPVPQTHRAGGVQQRYYSSANFALLERLDKVAARYQTTNVQVALAWLLTRPGITAPIASATSVAQTNELLGALKLKLDADALQLLNAE